MKTKKEGHHFIRLCSRHARKGYQIHKLNWCSWVRSTDESLGFIEDYGLRDELS